MAVSELTIITYTIEIKFHVHRIHFGSNYIFYIQGKIFLNS